MVPQVDCSVILMCSLDEASTACIYSTILDLPKPGILAGAATLLCLRVLAQVRIVGKGLAILQADIGLLTVGGQLVEE